MNEMSMTSTMSTMSTMDSQHAGDDLTKLRDHVSFLGGAVKDLLALCRSYRYLCDKAVGGALDLDDIAGLETAEQAADLAFIRDHAAAAIAASLAAAATAAELSRAASGAPAPVVNARL
jgi:hypothetical protein